MMSMREYLYKHKALNQLNPNSMKTDMDPAKVEHSLTELINYCWTDELKDFEECYNVQISLEDDLEIWIRWCEDNETTHHIFYDLLVLKQSLET